jgi:hypothetical protein
MPGGSRQDKLWAARAGVSAWTIVRWRNSGLFTKENREAVIADFVRERELRAQARKLGLTSAQIALRTFRGWSFERACTTPLLKRGYNRETHKNRRPPKRKHRARREVHAP